MHTAIILSLSVTLCSCIHVGGGGACKSGDKSLVYEVLQAYATQVGC